MTDIGVLTSVSVSSAAYDSMLLDAVKGSLEGVYDDYVFFQYDSTHFVLLISDDISYVPSQFTVKAPLVMTFEKVVSRIPYNVSIPASGSLGGSMGGGYWQGSSTLTEYSETVQYFCSSVSYDSDITVNNPSDYMLFSSFQGFPHLIEGVQNYAFAAFLVCAAVLAFRLADRIFRRVY